MEMGHQLKREVMDNIVMITGRAKNASEKSSCIWELEDPMWF